MQHEIQRRLRVVGLGAIASLALFSLYLALTRIYQVDEAQNLFAARILSSRWESRYVLSIELWHVWPLAVLAGWIQGAVNLLHASRLFMLVVFWLNIVLIALNTGLPWRSRPFLWVMLGAATLAPLWDYGFEVRHETPLLFLLLLYLHGFRRVSRHFGVASFLLGAFASLMQFVTFKAFAYWVPITGLFLLLPPGTWQYSRIRTFLFGLLGFITTTGALAGLLHLTGHLPFVLNGLFLGAGLSVNASVRFWPWDTLSRLIHQAPLLLGLALAGTAHLISSGRKRGRATWNWDGVLPETLLLLTAVFALFMNPAPHPYNLCLVVPFAYILGVRWLLSLKEHIDTGAPMIFLWMGLVAFTHVAPFMKATLRHLDRGNERQERLVELAEEMTDPSQDRVYDAAGLVSSRESIGRQWYLHTLVMPSIYSGQLPAVRQMLQEKPAAVLIANYRFTWLEKEDWRFIESNYLMLSNDFYVLGRVLNPPETTFTCLHSGRYFIAPMTSGKVGGTEILRLDGKPIQGPSVHYLAKGAHALQSSGTSSVVVGWVGPRADNLPRLGAGDMEHFFFNWY